MILPLAVSYAATAALIFCPAPVFGLYGKSSPVLQIDGKGYDRLIAGSNHTSILEFYAPWCGHCRNLQPAYEKAAKALKGLAKVAAVDCDAEHNKAFCGSMGVQGFPTLKIIRPGKKRGRPNVEDYQGARTAQGIVDAVLEKIPNHVKRLTDKNLDAWLEESVGSHKAILFSSKGTTSALLKSVAIDFLGGVKIAQIRNKEVKAVEKYGITSFPTFVLLPSDKEAIVYDGEMKKEPMIKFLSQVSEPNPDPSSARSSKKAKSAKPETSKDGKEGKKDEL
ncbi:MAG: hypothetical protein M1825_000664 [Sarcosagium campestre]|nr:MAG: hypothetical protein M1825_000664 [Sarcosagium campestre]